MHRALWTHTKCRPPSVCMRLHKYVHPFCIVVQVCCSKWMSTIFIVRGECVYVSLTGITPFPRAWTPPPHCPKVPGIHAYTIHCDLHSHCPFSFCLQGKNWLHLIEHPTMHFVRSHIYLEFNCIIYWNYFCKLPLRSLVSAAPLWSYSWHFHCCRGWLSRCGLVLPWVHVPLTNINMFW